MKTRIRTLRPALTEAAALYRTLRLPLLSSEAGPILRECDRRGLLGSHLMVVGTNVIGAYLVEANGRIDLSDETEDFNLAWVSQDAKAHERHLRDMLKAVDPTFAVNAGGDFSGSQRELTRSKFSSRFRARARWMAATSLDRYLCPSRSGCYWDAPWTR